jgi:hypothetical protein
MIQNLIWARAQEVLSQKLIVVQGKTSGISIWKAYWVLHWKFIFWMHQLFKMDEE